MIIFSLMIFDVTAPDALSTTYWSGFTRPETMASPSPQLVLMKISPGLDVTGLAVNITPATSEANICCTTTASSTSSCRNPWRWRYEIARSVQSEAQQRLTWATTLSAPLTFK